ncbi:hypothetical protein ACTWPF_03775 [Oceanobacillus sp. M65]|uniref:hypothetical protein n=1 Tax=Oceanobacillus sp. M65 TaxID=3457435 RepID=UPI000D1369F0|nr:hypothetical protein OBCHQ24_15820 [Oceanobacillus iheyensis]
MDPLFWIAIGFIIIGFIVLISMKKHMESNKASTKQILWWIAGTTAWGIVSMTLVVWLFGFI